MTVTMSELMRVVRNAFVDGAADGTWRAKDGVLSGDGAPLPPGWVMVEGGPLPGIHHIEADGAIEGLPDGEWSGRIWLLSPPEDFVRLLEEINAWLDKHDDAGVIRRSERFGAYSQDTSYASALTWQTAFADRLMPYRKMFSTVSINAGIG